MVTLDLDLGLGLVAQDSQLSVALALVLAVALALALAVVAAVAGSIAAVACGDGSAVGLGGGLLQCSAGLRFALFIALHVVTGLLITCQGAVWPVTEETHQTREGAERGRKYISPYQ